LYSKSLLLNIQGRSKRPHIAGEKQYTVITGRGGREVRVISDINFDTYVLRSENSELTKITIISDRHTSIIYGVQYTRRTISLNYFFKESFGHEYNLNTPCWTLWYKYGIFTISNFLVLQESRYCKKVAPWYVYGATFLQMSLEVVQYPLPLAPKDNHIFHILVNDQKV
jgi:hypothetical protein